MKSKRSFFNAGLAKNMLRRRWPAWLLFAAVMLSYPIMVLNRYHEGALDLDRILQSSATSLPVLMLVAAVLAAMLQFGYLYSNRACGLMNTLPIRREGLFVTHTLAGLVMICIPCAVTGLLAVLLSLLCGGFDPVGLGVTVLAVAGEGIFYFASATLVAFIVGNVFALPVLYFIFHFLSVGLDYLVSAFASNLIFGLPARSYSGLVNFLSPTVFLLQNVSAEAEYAPPVPDLRTYTNTITSVHLYGGWIIGAYTLVGVVLLAAAYLLYRRRRSESAGDVISVGWMKPVFSVGVTACSALAGGQALPPVSLPLEDVSYTLTGASTGERISPFSKVESFHGGLDIIAAQGDPVLATADGIVRDVTRSGKGLGNVVTIDHGNGYETRYGHLGNIYVSKGQKVMRGKRIALVGISGKSLVPHLHYEVLRDGVPQDPSRYFVASLGPQAFADVAFMAASTEQSLD